MGYPIDSFILEGGAHDKKKIFWNAMGMRHTKIKGDSLMSPWTAPLKCWRGTLATCAAIGFASYQAIEFA
jgi:hypothetical protein